MNFPDETGKMSEGQKGGGTAEVQKYIFVILTRLKKWALEESEKYICIAGAPHPFLRFFKSRAGGQDQNDKKGL